MLAWATATWRIPVVLLLEVWKYLIKKVPLTYTPKFWSMAETTEEPQLSISFEANTTTIRVPRPMADKWTGTD